MSADPITAPGSEESEASGSASASARRLLWRRGAELPGGQLELLRSYAIVAAFLAMFIALSIASGSFLTKNNLLNILDENSPALIIACAQTIVIIGGGFDLSVGAVFALGGVLAAQMAPHMAVWQALALGSLFGLGLGALNGALVTVGRVNAFIATLASSFVFYGFGQVMTNGFLVTVTKPGFSTLGNGTFLTIKYTIWLALVVFLLTGFVLHRTVFGRYVFAVGGNAESARLSGIRVSGIRAATFAISGLAAGIAGVLAASEISQGQANTGSDYTLTTIAAVVLGGTSILGGEGAIWRTVLGVLILAMVTNGFDLLNVNPIYQQIVEGAIIVGAVAFDAWSRGSVR